jgi:hypothetical protein
MCMGTVRTFILILTDFNIEWHIIEMNKWRVGGLWCIAKMDRAIIRQKDKRSYPLPRFFSSNDWLFLCSETEGPGQQPSTICWIDWFNASPLNWTTICFKTRLVLWDLVTSHYEILLSWLKTEPGVFQPSRWMEKPGVPQGAQYILLS